MSTKRQDALRNAQQVALNELTLLGFEEGHVRNISRVMAKYVAACVRAELEAERARVSLHNAAKAMHDLGASIERMTQRRRT